MPWTTSRVSLPCIYVLLLCKRESFCFGWHVLPIAASKSTTNWLQRIGEASRVMWTAAWNATRISSPPFYAPGNICAYSTLSAFHVMCLPHWILVSFSPLLASIGVNTPPSPTPHSFLKIYHSYKAIKKCPGGNQKHQNIVINKEISYGTSSTMLNRIHLDIWMSLLVFSNVACTWSWMLWSMWLSQGHV